MNGSQKGFIHWVRYYCSLLGKLARWGVVLVLVCAVSGCVELGRRVSKLLSPGIDTPTPYITPALQGTDLIDATPYPQGTPVYDKEACQMDGSGYEYLLDAASIYYPFDHGLRKQAGNADHNELPPIIEEMQAIHAEFLKLDPPLECEIMVALDMAYEAELDQTIRGFIAFHNAEEFDVWTGFLLEATFQQRQVKALLDRIYFRD